MADRGRLSSYAAGTFARQPLFTGCIGTLPVSLCLPFFPLAVLARVGNSGRIHQRVYRQSVHQVFRNCYSCRYSVDWLCCRLNVRQLVRLGDSISLNVCFASSLHFHNPSQVHFGPMTCRHINFCTPIRQRIQVEGRRSLSPVYGIQKAWNWAADSGEWPRIAVDCRGLCRGSGRNKPDSTGIDVLVKTGIYVLQKRPTTRIPFLSFQLSAQILQRSGYRNAGLTVPS